MSDSTVQYHSKLVGVTFENRQEVIKVLAGTEPLRVRREADNEYDSNAVAVDVLFGEEWAPIGYIAKDKNQDIAAALDAGGTVYIGIASISGGGNQSFGVNIKLEYKKAELKEKAPVATERPLTPIEKLQEAIQEYSETLQGKTKLYRSRLLGKSTTVQEVDGHIRLEGYLSGSSFPKKFYPEFNQDEILKKLTEKHFPKAEEDELERLKGSILSMWDINRTASTSYGTAIHAAMENYDKYHQLGDKLKSVQVLKTMTKVGPNKALSKNPFLKKIVEDFHKKFGGDYVRLSEEFVWLHDEKLCGSIDRVKVIDAKNKVVRIQDFKTDGNIHQPEYQLPGSPFRGIGKKATKAGGKQKENVVEDTLLGLHWLQLSFYAYILKKSGYTVEGLDVYWVNPDKLCKGEDPWELYSHEVIDISGAL